MIEFCHIYKAFGSKQVLRDVSLTVQKGQIRFIVGISGAGKSVLVKHLVGLLKPDAGQVILDGVDITHLDEKAFYPVRKRCAMVFQHSTLFDSMSLVENVSLPLRKHKGLMVALRDGLVEMKPSAATESIQFERIKPRTLVMIVVGTIAGYLLVTQLAKVNLVELVTTAKWGWVAAAVGFSLITFFGAAWSLNGFVPERLKLHRTLAAQLAGNFATLVSPPTIGSIAINVRYLQRSGLHPALAAASVGVSQVLAFVFHIVRLFAFGIAAGTTAEHTFNPPRWVVIAVVVVVILMLASLAVPYVRKQISARVLPLLKEVGPRLATVAQRPAKLAEGIGGILLLNLAFVGVLYASIEAFGGSMAIAVVAVVYLAGATLGQAAPTPGGLGAVEAALVAGLTAGGLDAGIAVSAVLLYRLITFWIPTIPGYWAFTWLSRIGAL